MLNLNNLNLFPIVIQARLAQSVERGTFNPKVKGSSPLSGECFFWQKLNFSKLLLIHSHVEM